LFCVKYYTLGHGGKRWRGEGRKGRAETISGGKSRKIRKRKRGPSFQEGNRDKLRVALEEQTLLVMGYRGVWSVKEEGKGMRV